MSPTNRPLKGRTLSLSISESDDSASFGFPAWQVNRVTLQMAAAFFGQGATIIFGHDWREDGVMAAVYGFARQMQPPIPLSAENAAVEAQPVLRNLLPWPNSPYLPERDLEGLRATLRVEKAGLPEELTQFDGQGADPDGTLYRYLRARGLTFLRHRLDDECDARLCLGGRRFGYDGRYPGVIEEAIIALRSGTPLYLAEILGGAAQQLIDAIEHKRMPEGFCPANSLEEIYTNPPVREIAASTASDRVIDPAAIWAEFGQDALEKLAAVNGLTEQENIELFHAPSLDQVIEWVLTAMSRLLKPAA